MTILREIARPALEWRGRLVVCTAATGYPDQVGQQYADVFAELGAHVDLLDVRRRADALDTAAVERIAAAAVVFFAGGDQRRVASLIANSAAHACLVERYRAGATIAGTSAGAMAMSRTMLTGGPGAAAREVTPLGLSRGLGLIDGVVIDSHFAERGRFGRLLSAVAQDPGLLGIGVDEDTAAVVEDGRARVIGRGAVYLIDGRELSYVDASDRPLGLDAAHGARVHFLTAGGMFDLARRRCRPRRG